MTDKKKRTININYNKRVSLFAIRHGHVSLFVKMAGGFSEGFPGVAPFSEKKGDNRIAAFHCERRRRLSRVCPLAACPQGLRQAGISHRRLLWGIGAAEVSGRLPVRAGGFTHLMRREGAGIAQRPPRKRRGVGRGRGWQNAALSAVHRFFALPQILMITSGSVNAVLLCAGCVSVAANGLGR
jgi:hypothetical protein